MKKKKLDLIPLKQFIQIYKKIYQIPAELIFKFALTSPAIARIIFTSRP
jgi:hypothetical protein